MRAAAEDRSPSSSAHISTMRSEIPVSVLLHPNSPICTPHASLPLSVSSIPLSEPFSFSSPPSSISSCSPSSAPLHIPPHAASTHFSQDPPPSLVTPRPFYVFNRASYTLMLRCLMKGTSPKLRDIMEADPYHGLPTKRWKRLQGNLRIYYGPDNLDQPKLVWKSCFQNLIIEPIEEWINIFHKVHTLKNERGQVRHLRIQKCLEVLTQRYQYRRSRCGLTMEDFRRYYSECSCQQPLFYTMSSSQECTTLSSPSSTTAAPLLPHPILTALPPMVETPMDPNFPYTPTSPWTATSFYPPAHFATLPHSSSTSTPFVSTTSSPDGHFPEDHAHASTPVSPDLILPPLLHCPSNPPSEVRKRSASKALFIDTSITRSMPDMSSPRVRLPSIHCVLQAYPSPRAMSDISYPF